MKMYIVLLLLGTIVPAQRNNSVYVCRDIQAKLYSEAPLENIDATSTKGFSVLNIATGEVQVNIPVSSFKFRKSLMQEHFNENYLESDKYPNAIFKGKINEKIAADADGSFPVTVTGELDIHGVKQQRTISGTINVSGGTIAIRSTFPVRCKDHNIKIPTLVFKNIAESIEITISGNYKPFSASKT